jgi:hypothetical protein
MWWLPPKVLIRLLSTQVATQGFQPHDGDYKGIDRILRGEATHSDGGTLDMLSHPPRWEAASARPLSVGHHRLGHFKLAALPTSRRAIGIYPVRVWISLNRIFGSTMPSAFGGTMYV